MSLIIRLSFSISDIKKLLNREVVIAEKNGIRINDMIISTEPWIANGLSQFKFDKWPKLNFNIKKLKHWPNNTDILCWNCSLSFTTIPIGFPNKIMPSKSTYPNHEWIYYVYGCFCSFQCALSYNRLYKSGDNEELLNKMYKAFSYGDHVEEAPNKLLMIQYGGTLTKEQYKKLFKKIVISREIIPPLVSIRQKSDIFIKNSFNIKNSVKNEYLISRKKNPFNSE